MAGWKEPEDWIDINTVADNEILLLVTEGTGVGFTVKVGTGTGTFNIDWGDGTVQTALVGNSTTVFQHQHTTGGTACSLGYNTWKLRIYNASANITGWKIARHTFTSNVQTSPILSANFGAQYIATYNNAFYMPGGTVIFNVLNKCKVSSFTNTTSTGAMFTNCYALKSVSLPTSWGSVTSTAQMFDHCYSLPSVNLPTSWGGVTSASSMFKCCYALISIALPTSWGSVTDTSYMFDHCYSLPSVNLPTSWGGVISVASMFGMCNALQSVSTATSWGNVNSTALMFSYCYALQSLALPTSWGSVASTAQMFDSCTALYSVSLPLSWGSITNATYMFNNCPSLKTINNLNFLGSTTVQSDFTDALAQTEFLQQAIAINSLLTKIGIYGASGKLLLCTSIRLTNSGSTFTGSSPHINVSYTSLDAAALNLLFGDLPTLVGKAINITGCPGAATCTRSIATAKGWVVMG